MKSLRVIKKSVIVFIVMVLISGCYTLNKSHNAAHNRAFSKDVELLHKDADSFLGSTKSSALSE